MSKLKENIANKIFEWMVSNHEIDCSTVEFEFLADRILSLINSSPIEGLEIVKQCSGERLSTGHLLSCACHGTGEIVRPMTRGEAVDYAKNQAKIHTTWMTSPILTTDERIRVTNGKVIW